MDRILHYDIAKTLGEGKNGPSYLAYDSGLQRPVVLKRLEHDRHASETWWSRYLECTQGLDKMNEPGLAAHYGHEAGADDNFIIREYIDGESFSEIAARGNLESRQILKLALGAAEAIQVAHENDLIHGNISSNNLLVTDSRQVVICDFGLDAKLAEPDSDECPVSDFAWLSPEQLEGKRATEQSDLYSIGLVLKNLVTGQSPSDTESLEELKRQRRSDRTAEVSAADVPPMIHLLLGRLLAPSPSDRLSTAAELCRTIQEIVVFGEGEPKRSSEARRKFTPRQYLMLAVLVMLMVIFWLVITTDPG